ncbi:MAG: mevalonate kinase [Anaerolineae bacterium]|nr:MAG: mevalonate kinase [Anaerolineae bacterium]
MTKASAPGKVILLGEHAAVYGRPALAAPVQAVRAHAEVLALDEARVKVEAPEVGVDAYLDEMPDSQPLARAIRLSMEETQASGGFQVRVTSDIPPASGLGSSAAVSVAIIRTVCKYFEHELAADRVAQMAFEIEKLHHGDPSGIDNTVVAFEIPVLFIKGEEPRPLGVTGRFQFVIGDTGEPAPTKELVTMLRGRWSGDTEFVDALFDSIGELTNQAAASIGRGEIRNLGPLMNHDQTLLEALGVSAPSLERLIRAARDAGALGAKLSGAGGGGIMIALVDDSSLDAVDAALHEAGAVRTIQTEIGQ